MNLMPIILSKIFLIVLLPCFIDHSNQACISDRKVDGCSVPLKSIFFPYAITFHTACKRHDVCYGCGKRFRWSRNDCDEGFLNDMYRICRYNKNETDCQSRAEDYHGIVRWLGIFYYRLRPQRWCKSQRCVYYNGKPNLKFHKYKNH